MLASCSTGLSWRVSQRVEPLDFSWDKTLAGASPKYLDRRGAIRPEETLDVAADGTVTVRTPTEVQFTDADGFRPVCPFFELHAEWTTDNGVQSGPLTPDVLAADGHNLADLRWEVTVANLKAFHYTQSVYFGVEDTDVALTKIADLGGSILMAAEDTPTVASPQPPTRLAPCSSSSVPTPPCRRSNRRNRPGTLHHTPGALKAETVVQRVV